jgi:hypothetical protein
MNNNYDIGRIHIKTPFILERKIPDSSQNRNVIHAFTHTATNPVEKSSRL